jgi:ATP-binding cassette subfamily B protein
VGRWRELHSASGTSLNGFTWPVTLTVLSSVAALIQPLFYRRLINDLGTRAWDRHDDLVIILLLINGLFAATTNGARLTASAKLANRLLVDIRGRLFTTFQAMPTTFFSHAANGAIVARIMTDAAEARPLIQLSMDMLADATTVLFIGAALLLVDYRLLLALLCLTVIVSPFSRLTIRRAVVAVADELQTSAALASRLTERLNGLANQQARIYDRTAFEHEKVNELSFRINRANVKFRQSLSSVNISYASVSVIAVALALWVGAPLVRDGRLAIGTLIMFLFYAQLVQAPVARLAGLSRFDLAYRLQAMDRVLEALRLRKMPNDDPSAVRPANTNLDAAKSTTGARRGGVQALLEFVDVKFAFPPPASVVPPSFRESLALIDDDPGGLVIDGVSFVVLRGQAIALVGASGAGKSTIGLLAAGLLRPTSGTVITGRDGNRSRVAYVGQETWLFHDTIRANLAYARPDATDQEIVQACIAARIHKTIRKFPMGYNTVVGERGTRLSGGERQRIGIARALLSKPDVVVLDEPTAHLDPETEAELQKALDEAFIGTARLIIAHRLSTVIDADEILVIEDGVVAERGRHDRLLTGGGRYRTLYGQAVDG